MNMKERPRCRKMLEGLLKKKNCTLAELISVERKHEISPAMQAQARKMLAEEAEAQASRQQAKGKDKPTSSKRRER